MGGIAPVSDRWFLTISTLILDIPPLAAVGIFIGSSQSVWLKVDGIYQYTKT